MKHFSECPVCGSNRLIKGKMYGHQKITRPYFLPAELKQFKLSITSPYLRVEHQSYVCMDCGLILGQTALVRAQECVRKLGTDQLKERMNL